MLICISHQPTVVVYLIVKVLPGVPIDFQVTDATMKSGSIDGWLHFCFVLFRAFINLHYIIVLIYVCIIFI